MVNEKLLETYDSLNKQNAIYKKAKKQPFLIIFYAGMYIFSFSLIPFIPSFLNKMFGFDILYSFVIGILLGLLLIVISLHYKQPLPPKLSATEREFFRVIESLKDTEIYQKDKIIFSRQEAAKKLSKIEKRIKEPQRNEYPFWKGLMKENIDSLRKFRFYFKERLIPNLIKGSDEDLIKVYAIIEKFAMFLLDPKLSVLNDLNKNMSELNKFQPEDSQIKLFLLHPYIKHTYILTFFIICGYIVYELGLKVGASIDTSYTVGIGLSATLMAVYLGLIFSKKI